MNVDELSNVCSEFSSDDGDEVILWHEQRRRMKHNLHREFTTEEPTSAVKGYESDNCDEGTIQCSGSGLVSDVVDRGRENITRTKRTQTNINITEILKRRTERLEAMASNTRDRNITKCIIPPERLQSSEEEESLQYEGKEDVDNLVDCTSSVVDSSQHHTRYHPPLVCLCNGKK